MRKSEKKKLLIIIAIIAVIIIAIIIINSKKKSANSNTGRTSSSQVISSTEYVQQLEDGTKLNISSELNKTKKVEGLDISNIQFTSRDGSSIVLADVTNNTGSASGLMAVALTLLDKNGNKVGEAEGIIGPLQPGQTTRLDIGVAGDATNAYDFKIEKK